ncbi:Uncharacterised protein [Vibrio cholerae]|nr:Uncharacterised protein [Vibrio cholerae]CSA07480.1 Uncharacterised protein [Vibrio cholerae]CSA65241.1 Uncharacterised protein [Vibrio cholerae]CSA95483.1 Uncharacterised protein [Vibrio cholerae]CSC78671.1 Uncharacterised protein [Vibrio cholerae]
MGIERGESVYSLAASSSITRREEGGMVSPKNEKSPCFLAFATSFSPFTGCIFLYEFDDHTRNVFPRRGFNAF